MVEGLPPDEYAELATTLREDTAARARYDRLRKLVRVAGGNAPDEPTEAELRTLSRRIQSRIALAEPQAAEARPRRFSGGSRLFCLRGVRGRSRVLGPALAAALAACLLFFIWPRATEDGSTGVKGGNLPSLCSIEVYAVSHEDDSDAAVPSSLPHARRLHSGDKVRLSEYLQFRAQALGADVRYLYLFGLDGRMNPLDYYPRPDSAESVPIETGGPASVGRSIRLSKRHQPGPLLIVGLCSGVPLRREAVHRAVGTLRAAGWHLTQVERVPVEGAVATTLLRLEVVR